MDSPVPNAHDGYLDMYLDGGFVGLTILFCVLVTSGGRILRNLSLNRYYYLRFSFLVLAIVGNLTESNFARPSAFWFTTVLVLGEFPLRARQKAVATPKLVVENWGDLTGGEGEWGKAAG
jgi:O-antigen ligase